jgi:two-component system catabolic regulation response regulator CreB
MPRILIIEDEPAIADTLVYALKTEGFTPEWRTTGRAGLEVLASGDIALVVLDVGLPDGSGFEVCKRIRAQSAVPVIFLTARASEVDRVVGLEIGGDDYLVKPFSPRELTARVKAVLRRTNADTGRAGPSGVPASPCSVAIDDERFAASYRGVPLALTRYEFRLLKVMASRPGRVWTRDQLMTQAWDDPGASLDRTVDAHIKSLRAKLRAAGGEDAIETHRGVGYSLRVESRA